MKNNAICCRYQQLYRGFTLIELLVTITIAAILIGISVPNFRDIVTNNRIKGHQQDLYTALSYARSESVNRGGRVNICGRATATTCVNTSDWSQGWLVFIDNNGNGLLDTGLNGDAILRSYVYEGGENSLTMADANDTVVRLSFNARGYLVTFDIAGNVTTERVTFTVCGPRADVAFARALLVERTGRVMNSTDSDSDTDAIHEDVAGNNLSCS